MTGLRFLFRVTLRRLDLAEEIYHIKEPQKIPVVMSPDEARRLLAVARSLKVRVVLALGYGCGLRASEVVRLTAGDIDRAQGIIRVVQAKGRKDRGIISFWWATSIGIQHFGPQEVETMSQTLSPSSARCYGLTRVARVWTVSRASVYRSLKETPPNTIARRRGMFGRGIGRPYPPANSCFTPSR